MYAKLELIAVARTRLTIEITASARRPSLVALHPLAAKFTRVKFLCVQLIMAKTAFDIALAMHVLKKQ